MFSRITTDDAIYAVKSDNLNDLTVGLLEDILAPKGFAKEVSIQKGEGHVETRELHPAYLCLTEPCNRVLHLDGRKADIRATIAETIWVLAGRNDMSTLTHFLPRAGNYSDDGLVWRAGYGERLMRYDSGNCFDAVTVNQFQYVYDVLLKDNHSRQAIMSLWDPNRDTTIFYAGGSKDFPCSNHVQFLIRDGKLDCTLTIRSNDILWGLSHINVFEFTVMQEFLANKLGVDVGKYYHQAGSLHLYSDFYERGQQIIDKNPIKREPYHHRTGMLHSCRDRDFDGFCDFIADPVSKHLESYLKNPSTEGYWAQCLLFSCTDLTEDEMYRSFADSIVNMVCSNLPKSALLKCALKDCAYYDALAYTLKFPNVEAFSERLQLYV